MKGKTIISLISAVLLCITSASAVIVVDQNRVAQIMDYTNFEQAGRATKIYDPVNDKYTFVFNNVRVTGYYGTDGQFISEVRVSLYANGATAKIEDLINNRVKEFNPQGALSKAYTIGPDGQIYEAAYEYNKDGGYTIKWKGLIDEDGDPNTTDDQKVIDDAAVEKYDPAGRLLEVVNKTWNKDKQTYETAIMKYVYDAAGNIVRAETYDSDGKKIAVTYFDSLGREAYTEAWDPKGKYWYVASRNFYDGLKLTKTENYEPTGKGTQKLQSTTYYDKHGRISRVVDNMGRERVTYFYNDTNQTKTDKVKYGDKEVEISAKPGQIIKVVENTYGGNGIKTTMVTYFRNNYQVIQILEGSTVYDVAKYNSWLKSIAPDIPIGVDPTATGVLKLVDKGNGKVYVVLEITDKSQIETLVNEIEKAKDQWGTALDDEFDKILKALGDTDKDGKLSDKEWTAKGGKVQLYVGAIDPEKAKQLGNEAAQGTSGNYGQSGGGHAEREIDTQSCWNDTLMKEIISAAMEGKSVILTWTFWAFDRDGNLWIFAEKLQSKIMPEPPKKMPRPPKTIPPRMPVPMPI